MSQILQTILDDIKTAMKEREKEKLECLRTLHSEIKNIAINNGIELTDDVVLTALSKALKQKNESLEQFQKGNRTDLAEAEERKIIYISKYLPAQLSDNDLEQIIKAAILEVGAVSKKDMGKVMKAIMPKTNGRADGKKVSALVGKLLPA